MTGNTLLGRRSLQPEYRLLTALAGGAHAAAQQAEFQVLLGQPLHWPLVVETARIHGVAPLCYARLSALDDAPVPPESGAALRAAAVATAGRNLQLAAKVLKITAAAQNAGITLVPYKGPVLAELAYGDLGLRDFVDLDFILPHAELAVAWKLLEDLGYRAEHPLLAGPAAPIPGEYAFLSAENDTRLELHTERTLRHFPSPPDLAPLLAARQPTSLAGRSALTFCREDTLTLLAVHGAKDFWAKLVWVCDIAWLTAKPEFDWGAALARAERMHCRRMVNVAVLLAHELLDTPLPDAVAGLAQADAPAASQVHWLAGRIFDPQPFSRLRQARYRMAMVPGFFGGIRYAARLAMTPAAGDGKASRLPGRLGMLYAPVRSLRSLRR